MGVGISRVDQSPLPPPTPPSRGDDAGVSTSVPIDSALASFFSRGTDSRSRIWKRNELKTHKNPVHTVINWRHGAMAFFFFDPD